jgi:ABC-type uncharacterized transport system involved in gliding motility auxiliary subunit
VGVRGQIVKIKPILDSLKTKKLRYGGYATLMVLAALGIAVVVNLLAEQIPWKADLTQNKLYSLSDQTVKLLQGLTSDVTITTLTKVGSEDPRVKEVLAKYALVSPHIKLQTLDPEKNPGWVRQYDKAGSGLSQGTLVIAGPKNFKTIGPYDMYNIDYQSYYSGQSQSPQITSLVAEQRLTSALQFVTSDKNPVLYLLQGHGEETIAGLGLTSELGNQNYETKELTLITAESVPADADVLLIISPKTDFSAEDAQKIKAYLEKGGRAMIVTDVPETPGQKFPNIDSVLTSYGVAMNRVLIIEGDANSFKYGNPLLLIPKLQSHEILNPISQGGYSMLTPFTQAIDTLPLTRKTITVDPLLKSSLNSWGRVDYVNDTGAAKLRNDKEGSFNIAVAVTDASADPNVKDTRLVVVGSSAFLNAQVISEAPGNSDFFLNSLSWMREKKDTISLQPKDLRSLSLNINGFQALLFSGIVAILIPLIVLGLGLGIWLKRRHL